MDNMPKNKLVKGKEKKVSFYRHSHSATVIVSIYFFGFALFLAALFVKHEVVATLLYLAALVLCGHHVVLEGLRDTVEHSVKNKMFLPNIHLLMTLAAVGAVIIGDYREATLLILIFAGAHFLEEYAESKSKKEISNLLKLKPTTARLLKPNGTTTIVDIGTLQIGDELLVLNGDQVPSDGVILSGDTTIDESAITGESMPCDKAKGDYVFACTINKSGTFTMQVSKHSDDTVFAKILRLISQTQTNISKTAAFIKRFEPKFVTAVLLFTPLFFVLGLFVFGWGLDLSFYKTMVLLIVSSPCALAVTDVPASLSAISNLAKRGVLQNLADIKAIAFDKTGTLTVGKPVVTDVVFDAKLSDDSVVLFKSIIATMEAQSNHPLARAVCKHFEGASLVQLQAQNVLGVGLVAEYSGKHYSIGKPASYKAVGKETQAQTQKLEQQGKTVVYFAEEHKVVALIALQDIAKQTSKQAIEYFKQCGIKTVMITGDSVLTGTAIGSQVGIDIVQANVLPSGKSDIVLALKNEYGMVAMLGDGINDAPALVASDVGVAMGDGTDIAIDVADGVLLQSDLTKMIYTHKLAKRLKRVVVQNMVFALGVIAFLITMNIFGNMNMSVAVVVHEGSTLLVLLNGLRLLQPIKQKLV